MSGPRILGTGLTAPNLGASCQASVNLLLGSPYDERWGYVFDALDCGRLFELAMTSAPMFEVVMTYVRMRQPASGTADEVRIGVGNDRISRLPLDILVHVIAYLPFRSRQNLGRASRKFAALAARELQASVMSLLRRFRLCHAEVRFMQIATAAILAGNAIPFLMKPECIVDRLDFYTPDYSYDWVVRFFSLATHRAPTEGKHPHGWGIGAQSDFIRENDPFDRADIRVLKSNSDSALECVTYMPFSHLFGAVTAYGLWLAYPGTATSGYTLPNGASVTLSRLDLVSGIGMMLVDYTWRFRVALALQFPHSCGRYFECPASPRATDDEGCLNLFFPSNPPGVTVRPTSVYPVGTAMVWSLRGVSCRQGPNVRYRQDSHDAWREPLQAVLNIVQQ
ncbi:hypothetical protein C8R46DRAFT_1346914 [Mycena filopes]|nr:hypothetical protein C8R46DRAFT_1346914 [Mycena filopes]